MPVQLIKFERNPGADRNQLANAVLQYCRAQRAQPKITSARFFWVDGGNTIGMITEGQPGCFDYNPNPDPNLLKAMFAVSDLASWKATETWQEAGIGARTWDTAGRPTGA